MKRTVAVLAVSLLCHGLLAGAAHAEDGEDFIQGLYREHRHGRVLGIPEVGRYLDAGLSEQYARIVQCMRKTGNAAIDFDFLTDSQDSDEGAPFDVAVKRGGTNRYTVSFKVFKDAGRTNMVYVLASTPQGLRVSDIIVPGRYTLRGLLQDRLREQIKSGCAGH